MTGHDQFWDGVKSAVLSGCFADDFETHPIGTARKLAELEAEVKVLRRKQRKGIGPMRSAREAADDVSTPIMRD